MKSKILVVDDEQSHRQMLEAVLKKEGYAVSLAGDGIQALEAVEATCFDLILMDIRMQRMDGITALKKIREISPGVPVIIMTAYASVSTAIPALKSGANDYLTKPLDIEELKILISKNIYHSELETENRLLKERLGKQFDFSNIIAKSRSMTELLETVSIAAPSDATVLILGESGTGKELIANAIHQNSLRKDRPFIKINCAALPENLLESELFGHEKGAFTGADSRKAGRFQAADTGSIFLDEIAEMPPNLQAKILRVLQEQAFEPLGSNRSRKVNIRIIAATNRNPEEEIRAGNFREDLYYRLNVVTLRIPPLRERGEDILILADRFLKRFTEKNRRLIKGFSPRAADMLMRHDWPGNVRELENCVERAVILARGEMILPEDLPDSVKNGRNENTREDGKESGTLSLKEMEKQMILRTLEECAGNRTRTAEILDISRRTLQLKLKQYGINP